MSSGSQEPAPEQTSVDSGSEQSVQREHDSVDLALRLLVGLLAIGGDEAARRLQDMQRQLDEDPTLWELGGRPPDRTLRRRAWYLGVGLVRRGQRRLRRGIRSSYDLSLRTAGRFSSASRRLTGNRLTRPVSAPLEARIAQWRDEATRITREGELEEQRGRRLATGTLATLVLEIMDEVAKNPELLAFVETLIGQQGVGMATSVMDNARAVTLTADDAADGLLRWLLRRTPRRDLPPSPVEGQPQTMYEPRVQVEAGETNAV